ncbi:hypothetical protein DTO166G4_5104 [Paecilomyces variotii]|nr:hypothetical protein DTO032I3_8070 [Paecilomyces variotii]KAJ9213297.1 hypothetical protein DTO166G4_5104 [Paecilomyces variotii]KAJ9229594.1 hypothetical protein DTO166G5_7781 [Paecilomyces variotii]KAJ9246293.1 hypothetical protein DTO207G8_9096 [Paecilomyces variotii]KAJ9249790.1 hypothetical protein DTO195F2_8394 [Paecilomyces variotii]
MSNAVWTEDKDHSVEGHTLTGSLYYNDTLIWGPRGCHPNTRELGDALHDLDNGFYMKFQNKDKSIEGHTRVIIVKAKGDVILDRLSTHPSMDDLAIAVKGVLAGIGK